MSERDKAEGTTVPRNILLESRAERSKKAMAEAMAYKLTERDRLALAGKLPDLRELGAKGRHGN